MKPDLFCIVFVSVSCYGREVSTTEGQQFLSLFKKKQERIVLCVLLVQRSNVSALAFRDGRLNE